MFLPKKKQQGYFYFIYFLPIMKFFILYYFHYMFCIFVFFLEFWIAYLALYALCQSKLYIQKSYKYSHKDYM